MTMGKVIKKRSQKAGLPPGTLVHVGEEKAEAVRITVIDYDEQSFQEKQVTNIEECFEFKTTPTITWVNIDGIHNIEIIEKIGRHYELHPLLLEDIVTTWQRPKFEDFEKYLFIVIRMLNYNEQKQAIESEQMSLVLGQNFVISFQETIGDVFDQIRDRIRTGKGRHRKMGADYLTYSLIDAIVDNYFATLERIGEKIDVMQEDLVAERMEKTAEQIIKFKKEILQLRKSIWPLRELINGLQRSESSLISEPTHVYLRDVYDHTLQIMDGVEGFRDMVSMTLEAYVSAISNNLNAIMKVLAVIATIFMPLTLVTGVYGMNFKHMPEIQWRWGYPIVLMCMLVITVLMLLYFRKKRWL
jgi:magnesium transporter